MKLRVSRLALRQASLAMSVALGVGIVFAGVQLTLDWKQERASLDDNLQLIMDTQKTQAARAVFDLDQDLARNIASGIVAFPAIYEARLVDDFGNVLASAFREPTTQRWRRLADWLFGESKFKTAMLYYYPDHPPVGQLTVTVDTYLLARNFFHRALVTLGSGIIRNVVTGFIFFLIFHFSVAMPLIRMQKRVRRFRTDAPMLSQVQVCHAHQDDEIGLLAFSINRMLSSLDTALQTSQQAQHALEAHQDTLEATIARRTQSLRKLSSRLRIERDTARVTAEEAERAKRKAEKATQEKSRFLAAASHDLRQPLQAMQLFIGALERHLDSVQGHDLWIHLHDAQHALANFLDAMLDLSRLESGVIKPHFQTVLLDDVFDRIDTLFRPLADEKSLDFRVYRSRYTVQSDPVLLERILSNLVANAIRYTRKGGVILGCRLRGEFIVIQVWDSGPGIPEQAQVHIFDEFVQLENPDREMKKGLGLGLSIVKGLCGLLQHPLHLRSQAGVGSRFSLLLRRVKRTPLITDL